MLIFFLIKFRAKSKTINSTVLLRKKCTIIKKRSLQFLVPTKTLHIALIVKKNESNKWRGRADNARLRTTGGDIPELVRSAGYSRWSYITVLHPLDRAVPRLFSKLHQYFWQSQLPRQLFPRPRSPPPLSPPSRGWIVDRKFASNKNRQRLSARVTISKSIEVLPS